MRFQSEHHYWPTIIGNNNFHYPDWDNMREFPQDMEFPAIELSFINLADKAIKAYQVHTEVAKELGLDIPIFWAY